MKSCNKTNIKNKCQTSTTIMILWTRTYVVAAWSVLGTGPTSIKPHIYKYTTCRQQSVIELNLLQTHITNRNINKQNFNSDMSCYIINSQQSYYFNNDNIGMRRWRSNRAEDEQTQEYYPRVGFSFELQWIENIIRAYQEKEDTETKEPEISSL